MWLLWGLACSSPSLPTPTVPFVPDVEAADTDTGGSSLSERDLPDAPQDTSGIDVYGADVTGSVSQLPRALVYGPTHHAEEVLLSAAGFDVTVWRSEDWEVATTADFASFDLLVVDSQSCMGPDEHGELDGLEETQQVWGPAITGRVVVSGLDLSCHIVDWESKEGGDRTVPPRLHDNTMQWLIEGGGTAAYFATDWGRRDLAHLDVFGGWEEEGTRGDAVTLLEPDHRLFQDIDGSGLDHWGATYHSQFVDWPHSFSTVADGEDGYSVMLVRSPTGRE